MELLTLEELRKYEPLDEIDEARLASIKSAMLSGAFSCPPLLLWESRGVIVTGSHRVAACDQLYREANMTKNLDSAEYAAVLDMQIPAIDVSEIMDAIGDIDGIQYDNLSAIFGGTWVEAHASQNKEW